MHVKLVIVNDLFKAIDLDEGFYNQISFLRLAVRTKQLGLINFLVEVYKDYCSPFRSVINSSCLSRLRIFLMSCAYLLGTAGRRDDYVPVFEAMLKSVSNTEISQLLVKAFPQFLNNRHCGILEYAIKRSEFTSIHFLLSSLYNLHYDMHSAHIRLRHLILPMDCW